MEIDVMIIINEYQKEIFRLQKENIELKSQVVQCKQIMKEQEQTLVHLQQEVNRKEVMTNDLHCVQGDNKE